MAVLQLEVVNIVADRVEFRDKDGRGVWVQELPGGSAKWKVGAKYRLGARPANTKNK